MSVFGRILVTLVLMSSSQAAAETELDQFFPSSPIHENDRLGGEFEAAIEGCRVKLTEVSGTFTTVSLFDVQSYETDPGRLNWPSLRQFSTRYEVTWPSRGQILDSSIEELNADLRAHRISWSDRRTLSPAALQAKSNELKNWLVEIGSGRHGSYAQRNHTAQYLSDDRDLLVSVRINSAMSFPVQADDMPLLAHSMYRHALACGLN